MQKKLFITLLIFFIISVFYPYICSGQDSKEETTKTKELKEKKKKGGPTVLEEIVIEGRVQKPQAFYILQRSSFGYKIMEIEVNYIQDVLNSVNNEVF